MPPRNSIAALLLVLPALAWCSLTHAEQPLLVVGHLNPDTDSVCSAIAVAHLKTAQGIPAQAIAQSPINAETRYVLDTFSLPQPPILSRVAGRRVFLVDHTDYSQAPADLKQAELIGFADHHKLGGLTSDKPVEAWAAPLGAAATVVTRMYDSAGIDIPQGVAGCLLAAVLSDTVRFKSATTTPDDRKAADRLARIAGVTDIDALGQKLLEAKSDIRGQSPATLLQRDLKTFDINGHKVAIAQLEFPDLTLIRSMREGLLDAMQALKHDGYHSVLLMLTDVSLEATELLIVSDDPAIAEKAWGLRSEGDALWMPGVMSRKSQIVPALQNALK
ncbi:MAG: Inorganic diphosphatase [Proteobacteria bacterium]|nr:Inorganic diphosphatase [Pseudomonadota bacterium]